MRRARRRGRRARARESPSPSRSAARRRSHSQRDTGERARRRRRAAPCACRLPSGRSTAQRDLARGDERVVRGRAAREDERARAAPDERPLVGIERAGAAVGAGLDDERGVDVVATEERVEGGRVVRASRPSRGGTRRDRRAGARPRRPASAASLPTRGSSRRRGRGTCVAQAGRGDEVDGVEGHDVGGEARRRRIDGALGGDAPAASDAATATAASARGGEARRVRAQQAIEAVGDERRGDRSANSATKRTERAASQATTATGRSSRQRRGRRATAVARQIATSAKNHGSFQASAWRNSSMMRVAPRPVCHKR